ncbi:MAG TPA: carboxypeptidase-like regulatory domain-containing protein [Gemmatimonadaceae bacterium]|jgi:hypothetical protein
MRSFYIAALCAVTALPAHAQTGTFLGTVARDSMDHAVGNAEVAVPQLNLKTTTNYMGEFRIGQIPPGRYAITVRAVGFQPLTDSIDVKAGATVDGDIVLTALPVNLEAAHTVAAETEHRLPSGLQELEDRRKMHMGGFFVTDSMLRANDQRKLTSLLARAARIEEVLSNTGAGIFIAVPGAPPSSYLSDGTFPEGRCYTNVYVNGGLYWAGPPTPRNPPPNFDAMWAMDYSGVEYYASAATVPAQYNAASWGCGVLLLWTRR